MNISDYKNNVAKRILMTMHEKKSNLCLSADLTNKKQMIEMIDAIGPYVCMIKTHADIIDDFDYDFVMQLSALAQKHNFVVFEDRKFADVGNTVQKQYSSGVFKIRDWAELINCHVVSGAKSVAALRDVAFDKYPNNRGCLLIAQMSTADSNTACIETCIKIAKEYSDFVVGFICQKKVAPGFLHLIPGVNIDNSISNYNQCYIMPEEAIIKRGGDIIIVGKGIYDSENVVETAKEYQRRGWNAYNFDK